MEKVAGANKSWVCLPWLVILSEVQVDVNIEDLPQPGHHSKSCQQHRAGRWLCGGQDNVRAIKEAACVLAKNGKPVHDFGELQDYKVVVS